jgi:hypothetical protein
MSDQAQFPYVLFYAGAQLRLDADTAKRIDDAIKEVARTGGVKAVEINYLLAGSPHNLFLLSPATPVLLTGPAFPLTDVVDR